MLKNELEAVWMHPFQRGKTHHHQFHFHDCPLRIPKTWMETELQLIFLLYYEMIVLDTHRVALIPFSLPHLTLFWRTMKSFVLLCFPTLHIPVPVPVPVHTGPSSFLFPKFSSYCLLTLSKLQLWELKARKYFLWQSWFAIVRLRLEFTKFISSDINCMRRPFPVEGGHKSNANLSRSYHKGH